MSSESTWNTAIIVAAGQGKRIGSTKPKQLLNIGGQPMLKLTIEKFQTCDFIHDIIVVVPESEIDQYQKYIRVQWHCQRIKSIVAGGHERHHSVMNGLNDIDSDTEIVLIHDGARPFVKHIVIKNVIENAAKYGAAIPGLTPKDTIKMHHQNKIVKTLDRETLIAVQTPQAFRKQVIFRAYENARYQNNYSTDDSALLETLNLDTVIVPGDYRNIKITSPEDLVVADAFAREVNH
jgi:2-C-methyl-D-erythritol 4-phosphate cytidylyltransferase